MSNDYLNLRERALTPWIGLPEGAERNAYHWFHLTNGSLEPVLWLATQQSWERKMLTVGSAYGGPCLTPAEVAQRERAAELRGWEQASEFMRSRHGGSPAWPERYEKYLRVGIARRREQAP